MIPVLEQLYILKGEVLVLAKDVGRIYRLLRSNYSASRAGGFAGV